jgi:(+)-trans-carveol dehydrogenase
MTTQESKPPETDARAGSKGSARTGPNRGRGVEQLGRLDIVVANAGIGTTGVKLHKMREDIWDETIDVNLGGVWKTVKAGVPHLLAGGRGGSVMITSSVGGTEAYPHVGHYIAAKHGVIGLMRTFAVELGAQTIRVNTVHPTDVNTRCR